MTPYSYDEGRLRPWLTPPAAGTAWPDTAAVVRSLLQLIHDSNERGSWTSCIYLGHAVWLLEHPDGEEA